MGLTQGRGGRGACGGRGAVCRQRREHAEEQLPERRGLGGNQRAVFSGAGRRPESARAPAGPRRLPRGPHRLRTVELGAAEDLGAGPGRQRLTQRSDGLGQGPDRVPPVPPVPPAPRPPHAAGFPLGSRAAAWGSRRPITAQVPSLLGPRPITERAEAHLQRRPSKRCPRPLSAVCSVQCGGISCAAGTNWRRQLRGVCPCGPIASTRHPPSSDPTNQRLAHP